MTAKPCVVCERDVSTAEDGSDGCELAGGDWVCSERCWTIAAFVCAYRAVIVSDRSELRANYDDLPDRLRKVASGSGLRALSERARWEDEHPGEAAHRYVVARVTRRVGEPISVMDEED